MVDRLKRRLSFVSSLYDGATGAFVLKKARVEGGDEPYLDPRDPYSDDVSEPFFLQEWEDANESCEVIGMWCLSMVQQALKSYLAEYLDDLHHRYYRNRVKLSEIANGKKESGWFAKYHKFFLEDLGIDWEASGVNLDDLEHLNLTRNDFIHNVSLWSASAHQDKQHARRFPTGLFVNPIWKEYPLLDPELAVDRVSLNRAIETVIAFCVYLEGFRVNWPRHVKSLLRT